MASVGPFLDAIDAACHVYYDRTALAIQGAGFSSSHSYWYLRCEARRIASWLMDHGVERGTRVALLSESRPEWVLSLLGGMLAGATVVPLDAKLTGDELSGLLNHCTPRLLLCSRACKETARLLKARVPSLTRIVIIDSDERDADFSTLGAIGPRKIQPPLRREASETALLIYTSGTTSRPKGVETTFGNLHFQMLAVDKAIGPQSRERFLSVLPLSHLYELICGLFVPLSRGASLHYCESLLPDDIAAAMRNNAITSVVGVPLLFRALKRGIEQKVRQRGRATQVWFRSMHALAPLVPTHATRRRLFAPVLGAFGGQLRIFYSGGAALDPEIALFFDRMGVETCQGYGLSETSPVIATNTPHKNRVGSVGRPLAGVEVKIVGKSETDREGEILTRGPHVMRRYFQSEEQTREVLSAEGWLKTGDLGFLDDAGYLYVTGRSKDLIVLGSGKKVHPDEVEEVLSQSPLFAEVCVLGAPSSARGDEVCAVVVPASELLRSQRGAGLEAAVQAEAKRVLQNVAPFKRPTRVLVRQEALPKTATRKLKRPQVLAWIRTTQMPTEATT
jgi:long-chain acyl-CoA synthetase